MRRVGIDQRIKNGGDENLQRGCREVKIGFESGAETGLNRTRLGPFPTRAARIGDGSIIVLLVGLDCAALKMIKNLPELVSAVLGISPLKIAEQMKSELRKAVS